jgi:excisionase family DNA binding protein
MPNPIRISVSEASRLFGIDQKTVRRALKDGQLRYVVVRARYKINFESLLEWSQRRTTVKNKLAAQGIGQYVDKWRIKNTLYSPNPKLVKPPKSDPDINDASPPTQNA